MRQHKRRMPATILPKVKAFNYALVLTGYPHRKYLATILGTMDFAIPPNEVWTEDKPHASSLFARTKIFHKQIGLNSWQATSEPVAELQQKTRSAGLRDKSFGKDREETCFGKRLCPICYGLS